MKTLALILTLTTSSFVSFPVSAEPLKLGLKSTAEVVSLFRADANAQASDVAKDLEPILHAGQRAYDWINQLNKSRSGRPLSYSDPSTTTAPSMEHPKVYNAIYAKQMYAVVQARMPVDYRAVIEGTGALPSTTVIDESQFIALGLEITKAYDTACRWIMMQDYLGYYETQRIMDLRGYYFLSHMIGRDQTLASFDRLPVAERAKLHGYLLAMCINGQGFASYSKESCETDVKQAEEAHTLPAYYASKIARSQELWSLLFELYDDSIRTDVSWTSRDPNVFHYPFLQPKEQVIASYLKSNIEDEWHLGAWHLRLDFEPTPSRADLSHLEYQKNATAHMETNKIVMDENEPLTEYISQWTIRHEFGHLLGFKDCYVEFYDADAKEMVNYPLDPSNLMCSRLGHLQPQHFDVLKRAYFDK